MTMRNPLQRLALLSAVVAVTMLAGCSGGEFGSELTQRPKPSALSQTDGAILRLPQDQAFSITLAPTQETPALGGKADADAQANRDGTAEAVARVENGGSAMAGFQVGHSMKNDSDRMMNLKVRLLCEYETAAAAAPPGPLPDAKVGLNLYARDGRNRLLTSMNLAQQASDAGTASSKDRKEIEFSLPLGAREWINIYVAGSVQIEVPEDRAADGSVKLTKLEMEIKQEIAPPVLPATDAKP